MSQFKFFKNLLHLFYVNMYKQDFVHSLIHLVKAVQSSATCPEVKYKNWYFNPAVILQTYKTKYRSQGGAKMWVFMYIFEVYSCFLYRFEKIIISD